MNIIKLAFLAVLCIGIVFHAQAQDQEYNLDETYAINKKSTIHLNSDDADITIKGSDRSDVHLVVYYKLEADGWKIKSGDKFRMEVENRNGDLHIREVENGQERILIGKIKEEYRITIETPRDVALDIEGDDGTYDISETNMGINISADDAEMNLSNVKGDAFNFEIDDGSIQMDEGRGKLELEMDDGIFRVRKGNFEEIDATFDDSEVDINTSLVDDGIYSFDMDDGNLKLGITGGGGEFNIHEDDSDISASGNFEEIKSEDRHSIFRLTKGNARIYIDSDDGNIELQVI